MSLFLSVEFFSAFPPFACVCCVPMKKITDGSMCSRREIGPKIYSFSCVYDMGAHPFFYLLFENSLKSILVQLIVSKQSDKPIIHFHVHHIYDRFTRPATKKQTVLLRYFFVSAELFFHAFGDGELAQVNHLLFMHI